ncbi:MULTISPECIES: GGDEF domain-containing protein [Pantoea]|uniref:diguanylate cyclase n=1 Tax=Candidatus Pantoea multigeneris TaxID=2608357 RepID=A0ABX0R7M6_9GAMM|nr:MULTISPECIES: GGDEF domain-containing protein [Pantoea]NIF21368.1 diguanylate cyclase [Pantoea multigeneris]
MRVKLFEEHTTKKNVLLLYFTTLLFCFVGSHLRIPQELSLFWPVNAIISGLLIRNPFLHSLRYYCVIFAAMVFNDTVFSGWALQAVTLNIANMLFIVTMVSMLVRHFQSRQGSLLVNKALRIFPACLVAALVCAGWGALAQGQLSYITFATAWGDWFSEQFSTGLMLLPFLLTRSWNTFLSRSLFYPSRLLPLLSVVISLTVGALIGGAGSLTFPLPALIWCAIVLPVPLTNLIILLTGITEIILVAHGVMNIQGEDGVLPLSRLTSARLGVATVAISPLIVAVTMETIRQLNQRLALRANYDFLTRLLSRSGLYEVLKDKPFTPQRKTGVILLDVDYFKSINDSFGHHAGDEVLEQIARRIEHQSAAGDWVCRFGGEEFVVVVDEPQANELYLLAERIRQSVVAEKFWVQGNTATVTVSIGLAQDGACQDRDWQSHIHRLITAADKNLYLSKRNGRNQTSPAQLPVTSEVA